MAISRHDPNKVYPLDISEFAWPPNRSQPDDDERLRVTAFVPTTEAEREALAWLDTIAGHVPWSNYGAGAAEGHARVARAMLAQPRLPAPDSEGERLLHRAICDRWPDSRVCSTGASTDSVLRTIRDHLTKPPAPKTKEVEVWRVEAAFKDSAGNWMPACAVYLSEAVAHAKAKQYSDDESGWCFAKVSGPYKQTVPAD